MDKSLSQEEIDALFKQASESNVESNITDEEQEKIDSLSNYLYNQNEDMIKNMIEQKEDKIDELSNYLYNKNEDMIKNIIADSKENFDDKKEYMNSPYYQNYSYILNNMERVLEPYINYLEQKYIYNTRYYIDHIPNMEVAFAINYIGNNIPSQLLEQLKDKMIEKFKTSEILSDLDFDIRFTSFEYIKPNDLQIYRKMDGYRVDIMTSKNNVIENQKK